MAQVKNNVPPAGLDAQAQQHAEVLLAAALAELRVAFKQADGYRGQHARAFWQVAAPKAREALEVLELLMPQLSVFDPHGLRNLEDAIESSLLGVRAYREQFARVQWLLKAPRVLLARLQERHLVLGWPSADDPGDQYTNFLESSAPAPAGVLSFTRAST